MCLTKKLYLILTLFQKSEGYNFGTDISLEKKYELVVADNLSRFVSLISADGVKNCK